MAEAILLKAIIKSRLNNNSFHHSKQTEVFFTYLSFLKIGLPYIFHPSLIIQKKMTTIKLIEVEKLVNKALHDIINGNTYPSLAKDEIMASFKDAILLTPEEAGKIKFVLDILTQPVFKKDYPEYSKLATESLKIFDK